MSAIRELRRDLLWDLLVANPTGVNIKQMQAHLGTTRRTADVAIHDLRLFLGDADTINLVAEPNGLGPWTYRLVGTLDDTRIWTANRVGDTEARVRTMNTVTSSIVAGTDGRTIEGRKARVMEKALRRLVEDLNDIDL